MNHKNHIRGLANNFDWAKLAGGTSAIEAAKKYASIGSRAELAAIRAAMRPIESFKKQLEALDLSTSIKSSLQQNRPSEAYIRAMHAADFSALNQIQHSADMFSAATRSVTLDSSILARTKAIQEILRPSKIAAEYLDELTASKSLRLAIEHSSRWSNQYKSLTAEFEQFKDVMSGTFTTGALERLARVSQTFSAMPLLEEDAQLPKSEHTCDEVINLVQGVTEGVSKALTVQDAIDQIIQAIQAAKEPLHQRLLFAVLVPVLIAIVSTFVNPMGDFYVKKWLEDTPKQEATKYVKNAARETVGDIRLLKDFRFVSTESLALKNAPKAKALTVGQLRFGQTVRVIEKERDFTLVSWQSEDGKIELQGWVFSRYLKRFN